MVLYILNIYKENGTSKKLKRIELFATYAMITEYVIKIGTCLYALSLLAYFLNPIYMYLFKNEIEPLIPVYLPLINSNTINGYLILFAYHILVMISAFFGSSAVDFLFTGIIVNAPILAALINDDVDDLNEILSKKTTINANMARQRLQNILLMHQEFTV